MLLKMKLHLVLIMQNILLCYSKEHISEEILDLLQELDIKDVFFGSDCPKCWNQINLFKTFFKKGEFVWTNSSHSNTVLYYSTLDMKNVSLEKLEELLFQVDRALIVVKHIKEELSGTFDIKISQRVYFLDESTLEVFEVYGINKERIIQKVGALASTFKFKWTTEPNFLKRRSNFNGISLVGMTNDEGKSIYWDQKFLKNKENFYISENKTYNVTDHVQGIYIDVLKLLEAKHNFSTQLYHREDQQWGTIVSYPNGSYQGIGLVGDLFFKRADLVIAPLAFVLGRFSYIGMCHETFSFI